MAALMLGFANRLGVARGATPASDDATFDTRKFTHGLFLHLIGKIANGLVKAKVAISSSKKLING
jgi:hypothetical protein